MYLVIESINLQAFPDMDIWHDWAYSLKVEKMEYSVECLTSKTSVKDDTGTGSVLLANPW
jgi:hypothetical protein